MISHLRGTLTYKKPPFITVDINGVGYECQVSLQTFYGLPDLSADVFIYTQLIVREDAHLLFGFSSIDERIVFQYLIKINGVGPKLALSILSTMTVSEILTAIQDQDISALVKIPGVGKKTAQRLLMEVRESLFEEVQIYPGDKNHQQNSFTKSESNVSQEAIEALFTLGYKVPQAKAMISAVYEDGLTVESLIRNALKNAVGA